MAANVPNPPNFLMKIGELFTDIRDRMRQCQDLSAYISAMGGSAFLTAAQPDGIGMSSGDASALIAALGNVSNLATQYQGGTQAAQFNYQANTEPFWGGS